MAKPIVALYLHYPMIIIIINVFLLCDLRGRGVGIVHMQLSNDPCSHDFSQF